MGSDTKRTISFSVETAEEKARIDAYAKAKGFQNASALARVAVYREMARYPQKAVLPEKYVSYTSPLAKSKMFGGSGKEET